MAATTAFKRGCLDDAWDAAKAANSNAPDLRASLRTFEKSARDALGAGSVRQNIANGHTTELAGPGPGSISLSEVQEVWRDLIDRFDVSKDWLTQCGIYGLDPTATELSGFPCPPLTIVDAGFATTDADVYAWMMAHLIPIYEARSDYSELTTGAVPWI